MMVSSKFSVKGKIQPPPPVCKDTVAHKKKPKTAINYCQKPQKIHHLEGTTQTLIPSGPGAGSYNVQLAIIPLQAVPGTWESFGTDGTINVAVVCTFDCVAGTITNRATVAHIASAQVWRWTAVLPVQSVAAGTVPCGLFVLQSGPSAATFAAGWIGTI